LKKIIIISMLLSIIVFAKNGELLKKLDNYSSVDDIFKNELLKDYNTDDFKFILKKSVKGLSNILYLHYKYKYKNIAVDSQDIVISKKNEKLFLISGNFIVPELESLSSNYTGTEVFTKFSKNVRDIKFYTPIEKTILVISDNTYLTYKALVAYTDKKGYHLGDIYLDSNSGKIIDFHSNKYETLFRRIYTFEDKCFTSSAIYNDLPGDYLFLEGHENDEDVSALYAYNNTGITYWFYKFLLHRNSFDNRGGELVSTLHVKFYDEGYGCHGYNASFLGYPFYQMVYGDGNPNNPNDDYSRALDVVAHELTHAVTDATSDLIYRDESGALNEAMSDIFGATTEAWADSGGTSEGNPVNFVANDNTWKIGESIGSVMRYMNTPALARQSQPDHYENLKYIGTQRDNGGVHINSGIINLAYYLLVEGGSHPVRIQDLQKVKGLGLEKAIKIFYEAQIGLFVNSTNFSMARSYLSLAAENLYGNCSDESEQVNRVFDILGVPGNRREECVKSCDELNCAQIENSFCVDIITNSYCKCNDGYHWNEESSACEEDYICYNITCEMNNSHCEEYNNAPLCICDEGYYPDGQACLKKEDDPCENINCGGHGQCITENNETFCNCNTGYEQSDNKLSCVIYTNPCNDIDCSNHGNCVVKNSEALCGCFDGYHAENLECIEDEVDLCDGVSCSGHGSCLVDGNTASCICESGYKADKQECIKENANSENNNKPEAESSGCSYGNSSNSLFIYFIMILIIFRKRLFNSKLL